MISRLERARRAAGLSQAQLAAKADCHASLISMIERHYRPSSDALERIAAALDCETWQLFPPLLEDDRTPAQLPGRGAGLTRALLRS